MLNANVMRSRGPAAADQNVQQFHYDWAYYEHIMNRLGRGTNQNNVEGTT